MPSECKVCSAENQAEIEALGLRAQAGELSWSEVARQLNWTHAKGVQNHLAKHYTPAPAAAEVADEEFDALMERTMAELREQWAFAPIEVKPFYAVAIQNLKGLKDTKASQQHLINALKAVHEVTGMKMEQRLMLDFAKHHFGQVGAGAKAAVEQHTAVIDVDEAGDE